MENELKVEIRGNVRVEEGDSVFKIYLKDKLELLVEYDYLLGKWKVTCFDKEIPIGGMLDYPLEQKDAVIVEVLRRYENLITRALDVADFRRRYFYMMVLLLLFTVIKLFIMNTVIAFICSIGSLVVYLALTLMCVYAFLKTKEFGAFVSALIWAVFTVLYFKTFIPGFIL